MLPALLSLLPLAAAEPYLNASEEYQSGAMGPGPSQTFKSSSAKPPLFNFNTFPESQPKEGLLWIAPRGKDAARGGAHIFEWNGELVWDGSEFGEAMSFTPVTYANAPAIALWQGQFNQAGYGNGHGLVLNQSYDVVANFSVTVPNKTATMDFHEYQITDNDTALVTAYVTEPADLTKYGSDAQQGFIMSGWALEVNISTGETIWSWDSLEHVDPSQCYAPPGETGKTEEVPFDYFHINSIAKDSKGNYLISSRHCNAAYYVSGQDGSMIWQLGGKNSTIQMGNDTSFSWAHDARFHADNVVSIFDNAGTGWVHDRPSSRGMLLTVDQEAKTAELKAQMLPQNTSAVSESQGNMDGQGGGDNGTLPDTWLSGWGQMPFITEHDSEGKLLWSAQFGVGDVQSYRAHRSKWVGIPRTNANLTVNSNNTDALEMFVSWNGATEVATWEILGSEDKEGGNSTSLGNVTRTGFETSHQLSRDNATQAFFQAKALDSNGTTIGFSNFVSSNGTETARPSADQSSQVTPPAAQSSSPTGESGESQSSGATTRTVVSAGAVVLAAIAGACLL